MTTDASVVLYDRSKKISVAVTEQMIERWKYPTVIALGVQKSPARPYGWTSWSLESGNWSQLGRTYEFMSVGIKHHLEYVNVTHWYLWGEVNVQVSAEIPSVDWEGQTSLYVELQKVLTSFAPHDDTTFLDKSDVLALMGTRLDERESGIYGRDEVLRARVELSCRQIFTDLLNLPVYRGEGVWQASASTLVGTEWWQIFEPSGTIQALISNQGVC